MTRLRITGWVALPLALCLMFGALAPGTVTATVPQVVTFADPGLESAVRDALERPLGDITVEDMAGLTWLLAYERGISDLSGLETAVNLEVLSLWRNQVSDISPLSGLTSLRQLFLSDNQVSDISPLAGLTDLWRLVLPGNLISDVSPLSGLTSLRWLRLTDNQVSDISPLSNLTDLRRLYLSGNQVSDIGPLAGLAGLQWLELSGNKVTDISVLSGLAALQWLYLGHNRVDDISALADLTDLHVVLLPGNDISDVSPLLANSDVGGLGVGDYVDLGENPIDFTSASAAAVGVEALRDRGVGVRTTLPPSPEYADVPPDLEEVCAVLGRLRIMRGWSGGFWPEEPFTREQLAAVVVRLVGLDGEALENAGRPADMYMDASEASLWSIRYLVTAFENHLMRGDSTGEGRVFDATGTVTFDETVTVVLRALGYETEAMKTDWPQAYRDAALEIGLISLEIHAVSGEPATRGQIAGIAGAAVLEVPGADGAYLSPDHVAVAADGTILEQRQVFIDDEIEILDITYWSDGLRVKGYLARPLSLGPHPAVIRARGGAGALGLQRPSNLEPYARHGYVAMGTQYRGDKGGEGQDGYGGDDVNDVLNLIPLLAGLPYVDSGAIGIVGYSRGGTMVYRALAEQTLRGLDDIRVGVVVAGPSDFVQSYHDRPEMLAEVYGPMIGGSARTLPDEYERRSAVMWADRINAPLLILHGTDDWRVCVSQALNMAAQLEHHGKDVRLVIHEGDDHSLTLNQGGLPEILEWLDGYLRD